MQKNQKNLMVGSMRTIGTDRRTELVSQDHAARVQKIVPICSVKGTLFLWDPFYLHCKAPSHVSLKVYVYEFYRTCVSELAFSVRPSVAKGFHALALHLGNEVQELGANCGRFFDNFQLTLKSFLGFTGIPVYFPSPI